MVDIRPVTLPNAADVVAAIEAEVAERGADGAYLNGWDALLQNGLPDQTLALLDGIVPETALVIVHNSGRKAYFDSAAAARVGITRDTPDPKGASYGRDSNGDLNGTAEEIQAVFPLLSVAIQPSDYPAMLRAELARLNRAGLTTCSEMASTRSSDRWSSRCTFQGDAGCRHHPRRLRGSPARASPRRPPAAARTRRRHT